MVSVLSLTTATGDKNVTVGHAGTYVFAIIIQPKHPAENLSYMYFL